MALANYSATLPDFLDICIYQVLNAQYTTQGTVFVSKRWDLKKTLDYLGTYFPRSYAEGFCIFSDYFRVNKSIWGQKEELRIFDLGCGCGGELIGLLEAVRHELPNVKSVMIRAIDGNPYGVTICHTLIGCYKIKYRLAVDYDIRCESFDDIMQFKSIPERAGNGYDIILSFKTFNEVLTRGSWGLVNPYKEFLDTFVSCLNGDGILCMADVDMLVQLMECPMMVGSRACDPNMMGSCCVKQMADFLTVESKNGLAQIIGECPLVCGKPCVCKRGTPFAFWRDCAISLSGVYYRDLMYQAVFGGGRPLSTSWHNLTSHASGRDTEKRFYVKHSHALDGKGDGEGLFYAISTVRPLPPNDDIPW